MKGQLFILSALVAYAAALDTEQCTKAKSGSCCEGYTYNDTPLHKRTTAPVCDGSLDPVPGSTAPTCPADGNGGTKEPVCTEIVKIPMGSADGTLYCGNPLANTGEGTSRGTFRVEIAPCPAPTTGLCFKLTATAPSGTTLEDDYKVEISMTKHTVSVPGKFQTKVASQPVYVPFSIVFKDTNPCDTTNVWIAFHAQTSSNTCWAGVDNRDELTPIGTGTGGNWALQFPFNLDCKEYCKSWCCCPPPPTIPDCPTDYTDSCPGLCSPSESGASCDLLEIPNPDGWSENPLYADKCCCKPPDNPHCTSGEEHLLDSDTHTCAAFQGVCGAPIHGNFADCRTGDYKEACCCCIPKTCSVGDKTLGACGAASTSSGLDCHTEDDGCGGTNCCCTPSCTPQCPSGTGITIANGCGTNPPTGQTCTSQPGGCGTNVCCCKPTPGECTTETAFGVPSQCTTGLCTTTRLQDKGCKRWGWYIDVDLSSVTSATYKLYAGAGQNNLGKGKEVGSVVIQHCSSGSANRCAFFITTGDWVLTTTHVEADCGSLRAPAAKGSNFACAPGQYNLNTGGSCGGSSGLPGTSWKSAPFPACTGADTNKYAVIFHAAVAKGDPDCTASNCGSSDPA